MQSVPRLRLAAILVLVSSCGGAGDVVVPPPPPLPPNPVSIVTVAPDKAVLVPVQTVGLTAMLRDASGSPLSGRALAWASTSPVVASVDGSGIVTGTAPGTATITATSEGKAGTALIIVKEGTLLGAAGGQAVGFGGKARIVVPAQALSSNTQVTIEAVANPPADPRLVAGTAYDFGPAGTQFTVPVTLQLRYDAAALPPAAVPGQFRIARLGADGVWSPLAGGTDVSTFTVTGQTSITGTYAILEVAAPVASIDVSPDVDSVFVGGTIPFTAVMRDAYGNVLVGRPITWNSSDPAAASVSTTGILTGLAARGVVTITARSEGQSGSARVSVLARVVSVSVSPPTGQITVGATIVLGATLVDGDGAPVAGRPVAWASSNPLIASVSSTGVVTGVSLGGPVQITATSEGRVGTSLITVVRPARIAVVGSPSRTDTIEAAPLQPVVVEVRDAAGRPMAGVMVRFTGLPRPGSGFPSIFVRQLGNVPYHGFLDVDSVLTDQAGQASMRVQLDLFVGPGLLGIDVPAQGLGLTLAFVAHPGNPHRMGLVPADTALHPGASVVFTGTVLDRRGNARSDRVTLQLRGPPGGATLNTGTGLFTALAFSSDTIIATAGGLQKTGLASVVPHGSYAWSTDDIDGPRLYVSDLDGSQARLLALLDVGAGDAEPAWSNAGTEIAIAPVEPFFQIKIVSLAPVVSFINWTAAGPDRAVFPDWSPDGQYLYFTGTVGGVTAIYRIGRDGSGLQPILTCLCYRPSISPDGRSMLFQETAGGVTVARVWDLVANAYVGNPIPGYAPEWSPAGDKIALYDEVTHRVVTVNPDGSGRKILNTARFALGQEQISWSTDGVWVLVRGLTTMELMNTGSGMVIPLPGFRFQAALKP